MDQKPLPFYNIKLCVSEPELMPFSLPPLQDPFVLGLMVAVVFSTLVGLSRLYTGMHTVLVRLCGRVLG